MFLNISTRSFCFFFQKRTTHCDQWRKFEFSASILECTKLGIHPWIHPCMYPFMDSSMHVCIHVCMYIHPSINPCIWSVHICPFIYLGMHYTASILKLDRDGYDTDIMHTPNIEINRRVAEHMVRYDTLSWNLKWFGHDESETNPILQSLRGNIPRKVSTIVSGWAMF